MAGLGIDWQKQKALLGLRGRLTLRLYSKERGRILTAILAALFVLPLVLGAAFGTGAAYLYLPQPWPGQVLGVTLVILWIIWFTLPIFSFNVNEGLDPTRLLVYPLSRRDFVLTLLLGTLFDYPTYFMLPVFIAAAITFAVRFTLALPILFIALILCYLMMVLTSQLVVNIMGGLLQSRRFRDVMILVFSLMGTGCWLISQMCNRITMELGDAVSVEQADQLQQTITNLRPLTILQWLPPGAAAQSVAQATNGQWGMSLLWLGYAALWVAVLAWVWWRVLQRIVTGEGFVIQWGTGPTRPERKTVTHSADDRFTWLPPELRQMALKELRAIWRTPQRRVALLQSLLMPVVLVVIFSLNSGNTPRPPNSPDMSRFSSFFLPFFALFSFWASGQNMIGMETTGLPTLLLTPASRQRILLGKSGALALVGGLPLVLVGLIMALVQGNLLTLLMIPAALGFGLLVLGVMSLAGVYLAFPAQFERKTGQNAFSGGGGCLVGLASTFLVPAIIGLISLPAAAILGLGFYLNQTWLVLVGVLFTTLYGPAILWLGTFLGGRALLKREPELLQATRQHGGI